MTNLNLNHFAVLLVTVFLLGATFPASAYVQPAKSAAAQRAARIAQMKIKRVARNQRIRDKLESRLTAWLENNDFSWYRFDRRGRLSRPGVRSVARWFNRNFKRTFNTRRNPSLADWRAFYRGMVVSSAISKTPYWAKATSADPGPGGGSTPVAAPIPAALVLFLSGIAGLAGFSRKRA